MITNTGAFSKGIYLILRGNVAAVYKSHHKTPLALYRKNSHFGEFCLMNLPAYVDYVAKTPVICLMIKDTLDLRDSIRYESLAWSEIKAELIQRIENLFLAKYDVKKRDKVLKTPATAGKKQLPLINLAANSGAYDQDAINKSNEGDDFWDSPEDNLSPIQEGDIVLNFSSKPPSSFDFTIFPQSMETKNDRQTVCTLKGKFQLTLDIPEEPTSRMQHYSSTAKNKHPSKVGFKVLNPVIAPVQPMMQLNPIKHPLNSVSANTNKSTSISSSNGHIKPLNLVRHSTLSKTTKEKQLSQPSQPTLGQSLSPRVGISSTPTRSQVQNNLHAILWGISDPHTVSRDWLPDESFDVLSPFHFTSSFPDRIISLSANPLHALVQSPLMLLSPDLDTSLNTPHGEEAEEQQELLRNEHERDFELISSVGGCLFGLGQYECPDINKARRTVQVDRMVDKGIS